MMERSHLKILRTILGVPSHAPSAGIHLLLGTIPIRLMAAYKQLQFVRGILALPESATPRRILVFRANDNPPQSSITATYSSLLEFFCLPSIQHLAHDLPSKNGWKALIKSMIHEQFRDECINNAGPSLNYILQLPFPRFYGQPAQLLRCVQGELSLARLSNVRIRLLLHTSSLCADTSKFRDQPGRDRSPTCKLCQLDQPEDAFHCITTCPALQPVRLMWLPKIYSSTPPPQVLFDHALGIVQSFHQDLLLRFLADLYSLRANLL